MWVKGGGGERDNRLRALCDTRPHTEGYIWRCDQEHGGVESHRLRRDDDPQGPLWVGNLMGQVGNSDALILLGSSHPSPYKPMLEFRVISMPEEDSRWTVLDYRCRANVAHIRQSRPDARLGFQVEVVQSTTYTSGQILSFFKMKLRLRTKTAPSSGTKRFQVIPFSPESGTLG